ncbi:uncharacterized protein At4g02000-like [Cornus florida]|uniref:uncharacterized protein At4g02000-like n=1 Tax=Cornus florida TaxID=4283 RepID=UPI0028A019AC|nr:uncharacterized protein At4g02000-like [Cornus florida]
MELEFVKPSSMNGEIFVQPLANAKTEGLLECKATLISYFLHKKLSYNTVCRIAKKLWSSKGLIDTIATDTGFFIFKFKSESDCKLVLDEGPWTFSNKPFILKQWHLNMQFVAKPYTSIPLWVKFYNIPLEYWNSKGFSSVASAIGIPLFADEITKSKRRLSYARICIEVSLSQDLFDSFKLRLDDDSFITINDVYQWKTPACTSCMEFGHSGI